MKQTLKRLVFAMAGKDPDGVVVTFATGTNAAVSSMEAEIRKLVPWRRHFRIEGGGYLAIRERLREYRIAAACVLFDGDPAHDPLRWIAFALAPSKILAFNPRMERHHLRPSLASLLFICGWPKDDIFRRPWSPTEYPARLERIDLRPFRPGFPSVAILTPYFPWPPAHGGAVRMYNLIRQAAEEFDIEIYSFSRGTIEEMETIADGMAEYCSRVTFAEPAIYRKPRWWGIAPPEAGEFESPALREAIGSPDLVQVEYTQMAGYRGDVLVEHDVTFDLARQAGRYWDWLRWKIYETRAVRRYRRVVVMSGKDKRMLNIRHAEVIPNGVDLDRFSPVPEPAGRRLLFVSSFAHYPNVVAYRFFLEQVWPLLRGVECTVVAGRDPELYWRKFTGLKEIPKPASIDFRGFVSDVKPLYDSANIIIAPTLMSAGTNLKVLEGLAAQRANVCTTSGCAGLGLTHGIDVWIADSASAFADAIRQLLDDDPLRQRIAAAGRRVAEERYGWDRIGALQAAMWRDLIGRKDGV